SVVVLAATGVAGPEAGPPAGRNTRAPRHAGRRPGRARRPPRRGRRSVVLRASRPVTSPHGRPSSGLVQRGRGGEAGRSLRWEREGDRGAAGGGIVGGVVRAPVGPNQVGGEGQPNTASVGVPCPFEALERRAQLVTPEPRAGVNPPAPPHRAVARAGANERRHLHESLPARRCVANG